MSGLQRWMWGGMAIALFLPSPSALATLHQPPAPPADGVAQGIEPSLTRQADQLTRQGAEQLRRRQIEAALASWEAALELYREAGNRVGEGRIYGNLGAVQEALGNYREAIAHFEDSLAVAREINDYQGIVFALNNLGHTHERLAEYDIALAYQQEALALAQQRGDRTSEQDTLNALGILYKETGDYNLAIATYERSLALAREIRNREGEANTLGNLANAYTDLGNYPQAIALYEEALALMQELQNQAGVSAVLQRLGNLSLDLGNPTRAQAYYEQSLEMARALRLPDQELNALGGLGVLHREQGDLETAQTYLLEAQTRAVQLRDQQAQGTLANSLGNLYVAQENYEAAQASFEQSLAIAQAIEDARLEGIATGGLALVADLSGNDTEALVWLERSLERAQQVGDRVREGQALNNFGVVYYELGDLNAAAEVLFEAVAVWESLRPGLSDEDQISLMDAQSAAYRLLQMVLIELKRPEEALEISERGRARAFVELVAQRLSAEAATQLQTDPPTLEQIRAIAQAQQATLVQYSLLEQNRIAIWVIQPSGEITFRETDLSSLEITDLSVGEIAEQARVAAATGRGGPSTDAQLSEAVQGLRSGLTGPEATAPEPADQVTDQTRGSNPLPRRSNRRLQRLHKLLIDPIADLLPTDPEARVVIIPQGSLFLVPFAALQDEADLSYLIERHTLLTAPAIQVLELTRAQRQRLTQTTAPLEALVIGNPTMPAVGYPPSPLSPLPNAEAEARTIGQLLRGETLIGRVATENRVLQRISEARILHFATHGLLDDVEGVGVPGAIALAPSFTRDGLLTANEILGLKLNAELVVLSACDTGRGRITGDGVIGLSRSFISAGAASVVVSLWAVPDDATAFLMTEFYRNLATNPDKAQALRQAMLSTMEQFPNSRDWAAFTLIGEAL